MKPRPHSGRAKSTRAWLLLAVLVLGLGLRVANLVDISDSPFFTRPVSDGQAYDTWAMAIVEGHAPARPFYQDMLYPYFLAFIYAVFGHSYWAVYLVQLALAMAFLVLVYDTTRRLFDWRAGIAAAAIAELYKPLIFYESQIEKTALAIFLTALFLWLFVRSLRSDHSSFGLRTSSFLWPLATGIALGLVALTRANTLIFAPLLPLALLLNRSPTAGRQSRLVPAALGVLGFFVVIFPVCLRNSLLTRELTLTTTQAGQNLFIGNNPYNTTGQYQAPPWVRPSPEFEQQDFAEFARKTMNRELSPGQVSRFYVRAALDWATSHGREFARLLLRKTVLYFNNFEVPDNQDIYFFCRYSWVLRLPLLSFGIVFGLGFAAMILLARGLGRLSMVIFYFVYAASVIVFFILARYRIPALPALLPFAGAMLPWLFDELRRRPPADAGRRGRGRTDRRWSFSPRLTGGLALILAASAPTFYPVHTEKGNTKAAECLTYLATVLYREGDTAGAVRTFEEALAAQPGYAAASRNLGIIMMGRNDPARAFQLFSDATRTDPSGPANHLQLGKLYARQEQSELARVEFRRAIALAPELVESRFELANALQLADSHALALAQYDTIMQIDPDNPVAHHNSAVCLYNLGRLDEARAQLEEARRLGGAINPRFDSLLNPGQRPEP